MIGVGVLNDFGRKGFTGVSADELYADVVLDNRDFDAEGIVRDALPKLLPHNSNSLPIFKYLSQYSGEIPEKVASARESKQQFDDLLSNTIKKNRERHLFYRTGKKQSVTNRIFAV